MKQVYSPANSAEAHMLAHLLEQQGIRAHVHGEALQGAVGELPAENLLQLLVADEHYDQARAAVLAWERANAPSPDDPKTLYPVGIALAALAVGVFGGWFLNERIERGDIRIVSGEERLDMNGDGHDDVIFRFAPGGQYAIELEADNNFDRRWDYGVRYDELGQPRSHRADRDFDGRFDEEGEYRNGLLARTEIDADDNGAPDVIASYQNGVLRSQQWIDARVGGVARIDHYDAYRLTNAEIDLDRDGFLETVRTFDRWGEIVSTETRTHE